MPGLVRASLAMTFDESLRNHLRDHARLVHAWRGRAWGLSASPMPRKWWNRPCAP